MIYGKSTSFYLCIFYYWFVSLFSWPSKTRVQGMKPSVLFLDAIGRVDKVDHIKLAEALLHAGVDQHLVNSLRPYVSARSIKITDWIPTEDDFHNIQIGIPTRLAPITLPLQHILSSCLYKQSNIPPSFVCGRLCPDHMASQL